jgi:hypothetical protein
MEDTRFGLVRLEFSESEPKFMSISVNSEIGEVTMGADTSSMSTSPLDGISSIAGLVSFLLKPPVICLRLAPVADMLELADTDLLKFLDSVIDCVCVVTNCEDAAKLDVA